MTLDERRLVKIAHVWAMLDGCEGADLLRAMCGVLEMAHYSYADEKLVANHMVELISKEIEQHTKTARSSDPGQYGYAVEDVQRALAEIEKIKKTEKDKELDV